LGVLRPVGLVLRFVLGEFPAEGLEEDDEYDGE